MTRALDLAGTRPFVCKADRGGDPKDSPRWLIKDIPEEVAMRLFDITAATDSRTFGIGQHAYTLLKAALVGTAEGYPMCDDDGTPIKFQTNGNGGVADEYLARIPMRRKLEIATAISDGLTLSEDELEKPVSSPTPSQKKEPQSAPTDVPAPE